MSAKRDSVNSVSVSFGEDLRDDVTIDVVGPTKAELKKIVLNAVHEALRASKKVKDITTCT